MSGETKTKAIKEWSEPKTKKQLKSFLGLRNFFRGHIDHYAQKAYPWPAFWVKALQTGWHGINHRETHLTRWEINSVNDQCYSYQIRTKTTNYFVMRCKIQFPTF